MIDPRIYRASFLPILVALVIMMFSVEPIPDALRAPEGTGIAAGDFDQGRAAAAARQVAEMAPEREPGSRGDELAGDLVEEVFAATAAGKISEQRYPGSFEGEDVELRNVIVSLPGTSERTVVVMAHRDSADGPGAASSAAATGVLAELATEFSRLRHEETLVFVSTDGGSDGASGAREFISNYPTPELIDAVVVLAQPGAPSPSPPHVIPWSAGVESTSAQLVESAAAALDAESGRDPGLEGFFGGLFRLALPSGLGEQAVLIEEGADAVAISGDGERVLEGSEDGPDSLTPSSLGEFGRAAFALVLALDSSAEPPAHGPDDQLRLAGNLIPGWALALLALTLLIPAVVAAVDALARTLRRGERIGQALIWVLARALPFAAVLGLAYLLALPGIAPSPDYPFDPARFGFGWRAAGVLLVLAVAFVLALIALRPLTPPRVAARETMAVAIGTLSSLGALAIWLINPYLALLLAPFAHLWLLAARPGMPVRLPGAAAATAVAALPLLAALLYTADRLELGASAPWQLLIFLTSGQVGGLRALLLCLLAGCTLAVLAVGRTPPSDLPQTRPSIRGPLRHRGPGSLGAASSGVPRR